MINLNKLIILVFVFCIPYAVKSQIYNISKFTNDDGLPSSYIYDITQDNLGYLVIGTGEGLAYYDGVKFKSYDTLSGLSSNLVLSIAANKQGDLFLGHSENGISVRNGASFKKLKNSSSIESPITTMLYLDKILLFGTRSGKIGILNGENISYISLEGSSFITKIINFSNSIFVATDNGLYEINNLKTATLIKETDGVYINSICKINETHFVIGTDTGDLIVYDYRKKASEKFEIVFKTKLCNNSPIKSIILHENNKLLISTWGKGLFNCKISAFNYQINTIENIGEKNGLQNLFINCAFKDFNGNIWIGTVGGGLYKYSNDHFRILNKTSGLFSDRVKTVFADNNEIFVGLEKGLQIINENYKDSILIYNSKNKFLDDNVNTIKKINDTEYLIGTENNGLFIFNRNKNSFVDFFKLHKYKDAPKTINHVNILKDSIIYIATIDGLYIYRYEKNSILKLSTDDRLPHNNILNTFLDSKNRLWFVAPKSSPGMIEGDSITLLKDMPNFKSFNPTNICEGQNGDIFISTNGDGVYKYQNSDYEQFTIKDGLGSNYVMGLSYVKEKSSLICTHQNGLSVFNTKNNTIKAYKNKTYLKAYENSINAVVNRKGRIYFGTEQGLGIYLIDEENRSSLPPRNTILNIKINEKIYSTNDTIIELPYDNYDITFNFIGIELLNPNEVLYKFKLQGLEDKFKTSYDNQITYYKVKEGEYEFLLTSENSNGKSNPNYKKIIIIIDKPIYKKWWFIFILIALLVFIVYTLIKSRTKKLVHDKLLLEQMVQEKTIDIMNMNKILEGKNDDITSSIDYAKRIQSVLLPKLNEVLKNLDCFIYFKPRDIVSGDFYWFHKTKEYTYIAAIDCTGHGVPGAFMSLIGTTFLDQLLIENETPLPSEILRGLDKKIVRSLRQAEGDDNIWDGMDMALCRINYNTNELIFAGASRPLFYIKDHNFMEIKSSIFSIGGYHKGVVKVFQDDVISFKKGDAFYIFSDGFADQFGGIKNKRYSTKKMKELIFNIYKESTTSQQSLLNFEFKSWKGDSEQIDDVLVIGVKL